MKKFTWGPYLFVICALISFAATITCDKNWGKVDVIIFSYNRPMQLYALLESIEKYLDGIGGIAVIYRAGNDRFYKNYHVVQLSFPTVHFILQENAPNDFKSLLMQELAVGKAAYVMFAVDDMIVKNSADLSLCISMLEKAGAYAFFLRLGLHVNANYPDGIIQTLPLLQKIDSGIYGWIFNSKTNIADWRYPHTVDNGHVS